MVALCKKWKIIIDNKNQLTTYSKTNYLNKAIKAIPEVVECHFTTGNYDLFLKIYATDNNALLKLIHNKLRPLGLSHTETIISLNTEFSRQLSPSCIEIESEDN